jgi:hypothetical protein
MKTKLVKKIVNTAKKVFFFILLILAGMATAFAEDKPQSPEVKNPLDKAKYNGSAFTFQGKQGSVVKDASKRYKSDADYFIDVVDWTRVSYDNFFLYLSGGVDVVGSGVEGGFATKIAGNHLGVYFNGNFFDGDGGSNGLTWQDSIAVLFANKDMGGIRFDLIFDSKSRFANSDENGEKRSISGPFTTSLQWGKKFGDFTPKASIGFKWPGYTMQEKENNTIGEKAEMWENAQLGVKLEAAYKDFSADYTLTADFGKTIKGSTSKKDYEYTENGFIDNQLNVYYSLTGKFGDKLEIKFRPQVRFELFAADHKYTEKYAASNTDNYTENPDSAFRFTPIAEAGAKYALNEKWNIYTGLKVNILKFTTQWNESFKDETGSEIEGFTKFGVDGLSVDNSSNASIGFQFIPSKNFSLEFGLNSLITGAYSNWKFDPSNIGGKLAVVLRK